MIVINTWNILQYFTSITVWCSLFRSPTSPDAPVFARIRPIHFFSHCLTGIRSPVPWPVSRRICPQDHGALPSADPCSRDLYTETMREPEFCKSWLSNARPREYKRPFWPLLPITRFCILHWGSEYRTSLVFKWSKEVHNWMVCYSNGDLNIGQF